MSERWAWAEFKVEDVGVTDDLETWYPRQHVDEEPKARP